MIVSPARQTRRSSAPGRKAGLCRISIWIAACGLVAFAGAAECAADSVTLVWSIDGASKSIQARQYGEVFDLLNQIYDDHAKPEIAAEPNEKGVTAIELMAYKDLLIGDYVPASLDHFLCRINADVCKAGRRRNRWTNGPGAPLWLPAFSILRYKTVAPTTGSLADAEQLAVTVRKGCDSFDASCRDLIKNMNEDGSDAQQRVVLLPIEAEIVSIKVDIGAIGKASRKLIAPHVQKSPEPTEPPPAEAPQAAVSPAAPAEATAQAQAQVQAQAQAEAPNEEAFVVAENPEMAGTANAAGPVMVEPAAPTGEPQAAEVIMSGNAGPTIAGLPQVGDPAAFAPPAPPDMPNPAPAPTPVPAAASVDLVSALASVKQAVAWVDPGTAETQRIDNLGVDVVDQGFDPDHCEYKLHGIRTELVGVDPEDASSVQAEVTGSRCGEITNQELIPPEAYHGAHLMGIIGGLLAAPDEQFQVPVPLDSLAMQPGLLGGPAYSARLQEKLKNAITGTVRVVNMSFTFTPDVRDGDPLLNLISLTGRRVLYVAAAGHGRAAPIGAGDSCLIMPACLGSENVLSVVATNMAGPPDIAHESSTNYGSRFDIGAPGVDILSTTRGGYTARMSGSSQATAIVSSAAVRLALALPDFRPKDIRDRLIYTSDLSPPLLDVLFGGRVNVTRALDFTEDSLTLQGDGGSKKTLLGRLLLSDDEATRERSKSPDILHFVDFKTANPGEVQLRAVKRIERLGANWVLFYIDPDTRRLVRKVVRLDKGVGNATGLFQVNNDDRNGSDMLETLDVDWTKVESYTSCIRERDTDQCIASQ